MNFVVDGGKVIRPLQIRLFLFLGALVFGVYSTGLSNPFHYDDLHSIRDNPHIRTLENIPAFFTRPDYFTSDPRSAMYRPLVLVSYALNYALDKSEVRSYHWVNIAIHAINSGLVLLLAQILVGRGAVALLAACIFALHPVNSEVVNYISSRSESLCALFFLVSLIVYIQSRVQERIYSVVYVISIAAFAAALLCKSIAVTLVPLLFVFEVCYPTRSSFVRSTLMRLGPFFALVLCYGLAIGQMLKTALIDAPVRPMSVQLATQLKALVYYAKLLCYPWSLNVEHQFVLGGFEVTVLVCAILILSLLIWAWLSGALTRFLALWPLVVLAPTLVVPLNVLLNEHRLYLVSIAFSIGLASGIGKILLRRSRRIVGMVCCVSIITVFGSLDIQRTLTWGSPESLWAASLEISPYMPRPHLYMGNAHLSAGRHQRALDFYNKALTVYPEVLSGGDLVSIYNNMGATYLAMGRLDEAVVAYEKTLKIDPEYEQARASLEGVIALKNEEHQKQAKDLQRRGLIALVQGHLERAVALLNESLNKRPLPQTYMALAQVYERLDRTEAALATYRALLESDSAGRSAEQARLRIAELLQRRTKAGEVP